MHISKLSPNSQRFLSNMTTVYRNRELITLGLAKALCDYFPIPPATVESVEGYFKTTYGVQAIGLIGVVNELTIVKQEEVMDLVLRFYKIRCLNAYPTEAIVLRTECGVNDLTGVGRTLDVATIDLINKEAMLLTGLIQGFKRMLKDLIDNARG